MLNSAGVHERGETGSPSRKESFRFAPYLFALLGVNIGQSLRDFRFAIAPQFLITISGG